MIVVTQHVDNMKLTKELKEKIDHFFHEITPENLYQLSIGRYIFPIKRKSKSLFEHSVIQNKLKLSEKCRGLKSSTLSDHEKLNIFYYHKKIKYDTNKAQK